MLRHGVAWPETPPSRRKSIERIHRDSAYVIVACPGDEFPIGAIFSKIDISLGLQGECWPDGMQFRPLHGKNVLTVVCGALVSSDGGQCLR